MGRRSNAAGTALATADTVKKTITRSAAIDLVKKLAMDEYRERKRASDANLREAEKMVGGSTQELDRTVLDQGRAWMTRIALISRRNAGSGYNTSKTSVKLQGIAGKISAICGELEAILVTDVEIGLFERVEKDDFLDKYASRNVGTIRHPLDVLGDDEQLQAKAEALLERYEIVDDLKAASRKGASKNGAADAHQPIYQDDEDE